MVRVLVFAALLIGALVATDARERVGRGLYDAGLPRAAALLLGGPAWRGAAYYETGSYPEAAAAFRDASFPGQLYDLGGALARSGQLKDAATTLDAALERDPNDEDARFNLALVEAIIAQRRADTSGTAKGGASSSAASNKSSNNTRSDADSEASSMGEGAAGDRDTGQQSNASGSSKALKVSKETGSASESRKASGSIGSAGGLGRSGDAAMNVLRPPEQPALRSESTMYKTIYASRQWLETLPDDPGVYVRRLFAQQRAARKEQGLMAPEMTDSW